MKTIIYLFISLTIFTSCEKEKKTFTVSYKITVISGSSPAYYVQYSAQNNSTQSKGPISQTMWVSDKVTDKEEESTVSLKLTGGQGCSYMMYIYVNGALRVQDRMDDPYGPKTITADL